jgi:hypothetical protein
MYEIANDFEDGVLASLGTRVCYSFIAQDRASHSLSGLQA